ncbi:MAG TPA: methyltransferase domain-containing protein [Candidatus Baltobacteraceae bacterium]|nr:methyltransferase domain-containing protein [Candidatus Baltobacteraceae bacterium]
MQPDQEVINRWTGSAPFWEKHREILRQMFAPVTQALAEAAHIAPRQTVLDLATGPGEPALTLSTLVGPEGKIFGIDPIPEMVAAARRASERLGITNTQFEVAFADHLPFPDNTFDAAISRFGIMFFPSPLDAISEILRVLKPAGNLTLAVWHFAERNPFHYSLSRVIDRHIDSPPLAPDALDAFRFANPGKLLKLLHQAGVADPRERLLQFTIQSPISVEDFFQLRLDISDKLRTKIAQLSPAHLAEVKREALASLAEFSTPQGISFPAEILILTGTKPPSS